MRGRYKVRVRNSRNAYEFELKRNITVLRGDSGRGKTTLFDMIREYNRFGKNSGVSISCDKEMIAVDGDGWQSDIKAHTGTIIVIDEDSQFIRSKDFAETVRGSDNYYLLITRNYLTELPISVEEIYELTGNKNKKFKKLYQQRDYMYDNPSASQLPFMPEVIVTEDSKSGFLFFKHEAERLGIECVSAEGKTKIYKMLNRYADKNVVVIADGAAFGAEIADIVNQQKQRPRKLAIYLPESFEWIILKADVVPDVEMTRVDQPELYADCVDYMSWEQYYTEFLVEATKNIDYMRYSKSRLSDYYLQERTAGMIRDVIKGIKLE
jgi:hypothetical protein